MTLRHRAVADLDEDGVLVASAFAGQGKQGGVAIEQAQRLVVTVRDGKVVRTETYSSVDEHWQLPVRLSRAV
jgi:ketosteroid isomerase-like protein